MRHTRIYSIVAMILSLLLFSACSHESADWKSASTADTIEAYQHFLQQYPKASNAAAAQARLKALSEDRDWQSAAATDTRVAYEQFLAQHGDSKWAQEARIRIENFAQGTGPGGSSTAATADANANLVPPTAAPPASKAPAGKSSAKGSAPTKVASAPVTSGSSHYVQLGAFSTKARAQSEWKQVSTRFPNEFKSLKPDYVEGTSKHGTVYRLRVPVSSVAAAKGLCGTLKKHSQLCVPVTA
jgi:cell division septation protein DedD